MAVLRLRCIEELPAMLTVEQVRQVLGISRPVAYQLANRHDFPAIRIGRAIRILPRGPLSAGLKASFGMTP
jgi:excisionase family DNA binding protein